MRAADDVRLMRYPHIGGDQVVFVYAGNIWTVPASGGDARQLTTHKGLELFPKLSPDGQWIAFSMEHIRTAVKTSRNGERLKRLQVFEKHLRIPIGRQRCK